MTVTESRYTRRRTRRDWRDTERAGLAPTHELDELVLTWAGRKGGRADVLGALVACRVERTIEGGSTLTLTLADPDGRLHGEGGMLKGKVEITLDGIVFSLVKLRYSSSTQQLELTFEDRLVYLLKRKRGAKRSMPRSDATRAEFILSLLREIKSARYRFVCPELHVRQPVETTRALARATHTRVLRATTTSQRRAADEPDTVAGFAPNAKLTVKGVRADARQKRNLALVLRECGAQGCSDDVMVATVCCVIQESLAKRLQHGDAAGPDSRGLFQQRAPWGPLGVRMDPRGSTRLFLTGGRGGQPGYKQRHGGLQRVPGGIEAAVRAVQVSSGGYAQHEREARRIVSAYRGDGEGEAANGTYTKSYQFARNIDENSWTAMQRLAAEVAWRLFIVGNTVYFMSEADLYARRARYEITPDDAAVIELSYDIDWGKPVSEMNATVALKQWAAPPGSVVNVNGYGDADGRWLVVSISRDYFQPTAAVTLRQPTKEKPEPAVSQQQATGSVSGARGESPASQVLAACRAINAKQYPYAWGGGHAVVGRPSGAPAGYDCSGATAAVLAKLELGVKPGQRNAPIHSSQFGSLPGARSGRGETFTVCFNEGHVYIRFEGGGRYTRFDTSPWSGDTGGRGPRLRTSQGPPGDAGFSLCHWEGW